MKILYVNPGRIEAGLDYIIKGPPNALLSIAAMVPEHSATLFDFKVDKYKPAKFGKLLREHHVCAITSMTPQIYHAFEIAEMAKKENCITIIGGYHPTLDPENVASHSSVDFAVRGEGEYTFRELIKLIDESGVTDSDKSDRGLILKKEFGDALKGIRGISYTDADGKIRHNPDRPLEPDLDKFPTPRYELLEGKRYSYMGAKVNLMETSRGCPHSCKFCCIIKMWSDSFSKGNKLRYRTKSVKRILEQVYYIYNLKNQKWDFIFFNDDNFTIDVKRTDKILDALIKSGLGRHIFFSCQSRVDTLYRNPRLIEKMALAGFRQVFLGIESVHQQSLDGMNKNITPDQTRKVVKMLKQHGISIFAGMIIGFPGETVKMVRQNIEYAIELSPDFVQFTPITAFPGTDFFIKMKNEGKITTFNYKYYDLFHPMMKTDELTAPDIYKLVAEAYARFYLNSGYIKKILKKDLFDPKFRWFRKFSLKWIRQFILGGWGMFRSQGITTELLRKSYLESYMEDEKIRTAKLVVDRFEPSERKHERTEQIKLDIEDSIIAK